MQFHCLFLQYANQNASRHGKSVEPRFQHRTKKVRQYRSLICFDFHLRHHSWFHWQRFPPVAQTARVCLYQYLVVYLFASRRLFFGRVGADFKHLSSQ